MEPSALLTLDPGSAPRKAARLVAEPSALLTLDPGSAPRKAARLVQDDEYVWHAQPVDHERARATLTEYVWLARQSATSACNAYSGHPMPCGAQRHRVTGDPTEGAAEGDVISLRPHRNALRKAGPSALLTLDPGSAPRKAARLVQDDDYVWQAQPVDCERARATPIRVIPCRVAPSAIT